MADASVEEITLAAPELWARPPAEREAAFARLRREAPVSWQPEPASASLPAGRGFWAVVRHDDVRTVSRDTARFVSGLGTEIPDLPLDVSRLYGGMLNMDDPEHGRLRRLVSGAFSPGMVRRIEDRIRENARRIIDRVAPLGECDFARDVAAPYPIDIICDMFGIPEQDRARMQELTVRTLALGDPEVGLEGSLAAATEINEYGAWLARRRREAPGDDLVSALVHADVAGDQLSDMEVGVFMGLLVTAGIETTGTAVAQGMKALCDHPAERARWRHDFNRLAPGAVEEIVRWSTPVIQFRRTAAVDTDLGGQRIAKGDKVVVWYNSANRDEGVFDEPERFDLSREPNPHVGFGGGGPHFCLGANLARTELRALFYQVLHRLPDLEVDEPVYMNSLFINGIHSLPCRFTPEAAAR